MQNLLRVLDFLLQTPTATTPIPYIPPNPSPSTENWLHHVQLSTSPSYDNDRPTIIYAHIPFTYGDYTIQPISPTFIKYCNEQVLDFKVDFDPASLLNVTTVLSRPWGFEHRVGFRLPTTQADSPLDLITNVGFIETEHQVYPILESFIKHTSECLIDMKNQMGLDRRTTIISRAHGFEEHYNVPSSLINLASYHLPDTIPTDPVNTMFVQLDWTRTFSN